MKNRVIWAVFIVCVIASALAFAFSGQQKANIKADFYDISTNILNSNNEQNNFVLTKNVSLKFDKVKNFSEGLAAVAIGDKWGFINLENNLVIPAIYQEVRNFQNGTATVKLAGKWLLINKFGQEIKTTETI